ncbi:MAG: hypothetical protein WCJ30_24235, partial [Deltaproteobacteria bacterium]
TLGDAGLLTESGRDEFLGRLADLRVMYEPYVGTLATHLVLGMAGWVPRGDAEDNWRTEVWEQRGRGSRRSRSSEDPHE